LPAGSNYMAFTETIDLSHIPHIAESYAQLSGFTAFFYVRPTIPLYPGASGYDRGAAEALMLSVEEFRRREHLPEPVYHCPTLNIA